MNKHHYADKFLPDAPLERSIALRRDADGTLWTNVPHVVVHHSPTGFEWAYAGSGPADLALNIAEAVLHQMHYEGELMTEPAWDGYRAFRLAWRVHQALKATFVATVPRGVGTFHLPMTTLRQWMQQQIDEETQPGD